MKIFYWTHLELQRYFNIYEPLSEKSAPSIWEKANALLNISELSVKGIFKKFNVYAAGTTDDPADSLKYHSAIAGGKAAVTISVPAPIRLSRTLQPDRV